MPARLPLVLLVVALVLAGCGSSERPEATPTASSPPASAKATVSELTIASEAVGRELGVSVVEPAGRDERRPLLVFLHGAGGSSQSFLGNEAVLGGLAALGARAPVVAFPEGEESWWHDRGSGEWGRYVVREVIPAISRRYRTAPRRVAIGGISMGGFGAYHLGLAYPRRFCAVGGHSAGLWLDPGEEFPGAFDDEADYERNDVLTAVEADPDAFGSARVWNDYGDRDWFVAGNAAFVATLEGGDADLSAHVWPGGHDSAYWDAHWPAYLRFYANSLAHCD
ncbi:MAG: alpha/beta hydrolase [Solirubrobacterales bacterium]